MQSDDLSVKERAVLFALLGEAREVTNSQLAERAGFRLDGKERRELNDLKLVDSRRTGRTYAHELTDAGWRWCATELSVGLRGKATSMEGALEPSSAVSAATWMTQGRAWRTYSGGAPPMRPRRRPRPQMSRNLSLRPITIWPLSQASSLGTELRDRLSVIERTDLDSALERMYRAQRVNLVPQDNQQALTDADRQSALRVGGEFKHLLSVR